MSLSANNKAALGRVLPPLLLTGGLSILCARISGVSLGTVIGGLFAITLVLPPLSAGLTGLQARLVILGCCVGAVAATWMALVRPDAATIGQWAVVSIVMAGYGTALAGIVALLDRIKMAPPLSSGIAIVLGIVWLTWPVWLSPWMAASGNERVISLLVALHPPLVCNGVLTFAPPWTEQSVAYGLTVLGQDVPLSLPANALPSIVFHVTLGGFGMVLGLLKIGRIPNRDAASAK